MRATEPSGDAFRAIADPTRRALLDLLCEEGCPALELAEQFDMTQPAVSQHLKVLREAGLVREHRQGRHRIYELDAGPLKEVRDWVANYEQFWERKLEGLGRHLTKKHGKKKV